MSAKKIEKFSLFFLPLLCELTSLFNSVLIRFGFHRIYVFVYLIAFMFLFLVKTDSKKKPLLSTYLYLGSLLFIMTIHLLMGYREPSVTFMATMTYFLPVLYWVVYCQKSTYYVYDILYALRYPFAIIAILGVLQFIFSPDLWGLYIIDEGAIAWASNSDFEDYKAYFRVSSILVSPQVFGLAMGLYSVVYLKEFRSHSTMLNIVLLILYFVGGLLSGTKSFFLILGIYVIVTVFAQRSKNSTKFIYAIVILIVVLVINNLQDSLEFLKRITDIGKIIQGEQDGRLSIYKRIIADSTFFGHGPGISQSIGGIANDYTCTESYLLMILYETGYLPILFFLSILIGGFIKSKQKVFFFLCVISMSYVHAFGSFIFFIFWPFILLPNAIKQSTMHNY